MGQTAQFTLQGLMPAHSPRTAVKRAVALPRGGPTGTGGSYAKGLGLTLVGGTAQPEIWTIDTTVGSGNVTITFVSGNAVHTATVAYNVSTAAMKTALETIFGVGSISMVTGTPGTQYVVTFKDNARVGGGVIFSDPLMTLTRTQRGSVGPGQFDVYDGATFTTIDRLLQFQVELDPSGARQTEFGTAFGQPFSPPAFSEGFFYASDIPNLQSGAVGASKKLVLEVGAAITDAGAILRLTQNL